MRLFDSQPKARRYVERHVPPKPEREADLAALKESLFEIPEEVTPGEYEFEGPGGLKVSFRLVDSPGCFDSVYSVYKDMHSHDGQAAVTGEFRPIFTVYDLRIETPNFSYDSIKHSRHTSILWAPGLHGAISELSHANVFIEKGEIYLIGKSGFLSRPLDLLTLFHELGHIETRTPDEMVDESNTVKRSITGEGLRTQPWKQRAYTLQRERDANGWMLKVARNIFKDIGVTQEQIQEYVHLAQLESYHALYRPRLAEEYNGEEDQLIPWAKKTGPKRLS